MELIKKHKPCGEVSNIIASTKGKKRKTKYFSNNLNSTLIKPKAKKKNGGQQPNKFDESGARDLIMLDRNGLAQNMAQTKSSKRKQDGNKNSLNLTLDTSPVKQKQGYFVE